MRLIAILFLLAGCTTVQTACPPLRIYDAAFNARLADEVAAMHEGSAALRAILDYAQLRDMVRSCG